MWTKLAVWAVLLALFANPHSPEIDDDGELVVEEEEVA
jgi:hypothetical protein